MPTQPVSSGSFRVIGVIALLLGLSLLSTIWYMPAKRLVASWGAPPAIVLFVIILLIVSGVVMIRFKR